ncbi:DNA excision repair protein ERCC-8-like [Pyrus ussuriensis x Pyrus communis]|uniref:DNA excision repair protein ERCC-8-like n=1 Tax=Pyrus ussuriensis x Pyrus communis TaxID=2448454 RepID=A0A5N5I0G7_9ROSA|nr:DNA excision repair protein ERCC-8-like [Pyrus ussuriensis x Pyrus communis]
MWRAIGDREAGKLRPNSFSNRIKSTRIQTLELSNHKDIMSPHRGSVNSLQLDLTEGRYLLSGTSDASAAVFDLSRGTSACSRWISHKYVVSSAVWYPVDTGLFVMGSYNHHINVWDTNTAQVVMDFKMSGKAYRTAMSPLATSLMLIAAGTEDVQVRLCDIASEAFAHTLSGHRGIEWVLLTGGCNGAIRFWDVGRAGCFLVLDQSQSQLGKRPPILERSATIKVFFFSWLSQKCLFSNYLSRLCTIFLINMKLICIGGLYQMS